MLTSELTVIKSRRGEDRRAVDVRSRNGFEGLPERALCRIVDLSKRGARLEVYCDLPLSTMITLKLPYSGTVRARVVWSKEFEAGCHFVDPISDADLDTIFTKGHA